MYQNYPLALRRAPSVHMAQGRDQDQDKEKSRSGLVLTPTLVHFQWRIEVGTQQAHPPPPPHPPSF